MVYTKKIYVLIYNMNDEKVKNLQEFKQVRNAYKDNLKQRIKIDKITENANI